MKGDLILSLFLSLAALVAGLKTFKDYLTYRKEKYIEGLAATANEKMIKRVEAFETELKIIKEKLSTHEGIIEAIFKMRKD